MFPSRPLFWIWDEVALCAFLALITVRRSTWFLVIGRLVAFALEMIPGFFHVQLMNQVLTFLVLIGVIVDPTTAGIGDSERALGYEVPYKGDGERSEW